MRLLSSLLIILTLFIGCSKKKEDPAPEPIVVTQQQKVAEKPTPYWPLIRSENYQCCTYSSHRGWTYEIYVGHNDLRSPKADLWQVKVVTQTNPVKTLLDTTISVWWENSIPKSDFFIFKLATDGKTWMRTFPDPPAPPQVTYWSLYQSN